MLRLEGKPQFKEGGMSGTACQVGHARLSPVEGTSYIRTDEDKPRGINQQLCKSLNLITLSVVSLTGGPGFFPF